MNHVFATAEAKKYYEELQDARKEISEALSKGEINWSSYSQFLGHLIKLEREMNHGLPDGAQIVLTAPLDGRLPGEIFTVNHDRHPDTVWVNTANGKGSVLPREHVRLATFADEGYKATSREWIKYSNRPSRKRYFFLLFVTVYLFITCVMMSNLS
ncbi:hypothetical protein KYLE_102 [Pantoea phage Kyle]|uniref:Uncharacterized protein n=1 Tax=Pantoea phage Kyle TaxID=2589665 RepID=A0A514A8Q4_9CAUD|nr:hypothetical protein HWC52_gp102 [Pantoea phage Kyle]QDH49650.1 hypothetical protein KYLE_102 [Pantoea phage Kyle]